MHSGINSTYLLAIAALSLLLTVAVFVICFEISEKQEPGHKDLIDLLELFYEKLDTRTQDHIEEMTNILWTCPHDRIIMIAGENRIIDTMQVNFGCSGKTADNKYFCIRYMILRAMANKADILVVTRYDRALTAPHSMCGFRCDSNRYSPMTKQQLKHSPFSELKNEFGETPILREYKNGWY